MSAIGLIETSLRHGQQTLLLSRLRRRHLVPLVERLDDCGLQALDVFGGAPYEAALTHLAEEPFDRLREVRAATRTPLLALLRGQALVGYRQLPDDAVDRFIALAAEAGIDIFRCFDPLNDPRNLARAASAVLAAGKHPEGAIVYTESPVHDLAGFIGLGRVLQRQGYRSLCLYDPAGLLGAGNARALVAGLRDATGLPISLHCATITGQASFAYLAGAEAGASALDVALSPLAGGASLPATEGVCAALRGTDLAPDVDEPRLLAAAAALDEVLPWYRPIADPEGWQYDVGTLRTQLAPSVVAHLRWECEQNGIGDAFPHVLEEIPRVRAEMGYPPLV
ncbi:MAG TPA: pyruvate carboxylase subunit B, partial [Candidatus Dormibacteraeota bacterium]|nr:pyruvate carboxylase subunit B [Candidatus Dormibacteraeota bacterium]